MSRDLDRLDADLGRLMEERLGIRGRSLAQQTRRAGRLLPRRIRRDLSLIDRWQDMRRHPKLHHMVDEAALRAAADRVAAHLRDIDPAERRKDRLLGLAGVVSFNLIVVVALLLVVLGWRGFL
jgi:hypothetical protein